MNETVSKMLESLKSNRWSVHKIEKHLGLANGTLGKIAAGKINFTSEREKKFHEFYAQYGSVQTFTEGAGTSESDAEFTAKIEAFLKLPQNEEYRKKLALSLSDLYTFGVAITKEEKDGKKTVISPVSEEGIKVLAKNDEILTLEAEIKAIKAEKKPEHIKTPLGEKSWNFDQSKRIKLITDKINTLKTGF